MLLPYILADLMLPSLVCWRLWFRHSNNRMSTIDSINTILSSHKKKFMFLTIVIIWWKETRELVLTLEYGRHLYFLNLGRCATSWWFDHIFSELSNYIADFFKITRNNFHLSPEYDMDHFKPMFMTHDMKKHGNFVFHRGLDAIFYNLLPMNVLKSV
jgi:hypothetical protein